MDIKKMDFNNLKKSKMNKSAQEGLTAENKRRLQKTYNSKQVCEYLAFSKSKLDKLCHLNEIPYHIYEGQRKRYFFEEDLIAFQERLIRRKTKEEIINS